MRLNHNSPAPEFISVREAARRSNWSANYVRSLIGCGKLTAEKQNGLLHVSSEDLAVILRSRASRRPKPKLRLVVSNP
ncbi:MAG: hypothetical protein ACK4PN_12415 [Allorhizobium sp.]